jgi:ATP/maltotriose-dependent transcriptional regulator MalT
MFARAYARALQGNASEARNFANRARSIYADMGLMVLLARATSVLSLVELLVDDPAAAERGLRQAYEVLDEMGETGFLSTVTSLLAEVVCEQGRAEEAERLARRSLELAPLDDVDSQTRGKAVLAVALARRGSTDEAESLAREAVEICSPTDLIMIRADALRHAGIVLEAGGKNAEASAMYEEALTLYDAKGNQPMAARVRRSLQDASARDPGRRHSG